MYSCADCHLNINTITNPHRRCTLSYFYFVAAVLHFPGLVIISDGICIIVANAIVTAATIYYTYGTIKACRGTSIRPTFTTALLREGEVAFY